MAVEAKNVDSHDHKFLELLVRTAAEKQNNQYHDIDIISLRHVGYVVVGPNCCFVL